MRNRTRIWQDGMVVAWAVAAVVFLLHLYFNRYYGYFRDELGYMACGDRLQWGYVDQPPLVPFLVHVARQLFGDSLRSIRLMPALAASLLVVQTAAFVRELGGRTYAMLLAALTIALAPQYSSNGSLLGTNCLEPAFWLATAWFAMLAIKRERPVYWVWAGVMLGLGMENKYSILLLGVGIIVGLLLTAERRVLLTRWFWIGILAAFAVFLPNLLWNVQNHWPFLELIGNIRAAHRDVVLGPGAFFLSQLLETGFLGGVLWLAGAAALLLAPRFRACRFLGWSFLFCYAAMFAQHAKAYYLAPIYPMLIAVGCVVLEGWFAAREWRWPRWAFAAFLLAIGLYCLPITVPVFSPESFLAYTKTLPFKLPVNEHSHARAALPQWYADQFGFPEIADAAAVAWQRVPAAERRDCAIFAQDYGQAGAIDFFGRAKGLPQPISGDRTYYLWGPREYSGNCMIVLDDSREKLETLFERVELVTVSAPNRWALESELPVYLCRGRKFGSMQALWPKVKHWR